MYLIVTIAIGMSYALYYAQHAWAQLLSTCTCAPILSVHNF